MDSLLGAIGTLCVIALAGLAAEAPVIHTNVVEMAEIPRPGYLESYVDPVFGSHVTRITGEPGTAIPDISGEWHTVARHGYSKDAAWNCDQSMLLLRRHNGYPAMLFLHGTTYRPLFARNRSPGTEIRWHPQKPGIMVYVKENVIGCWDLCNDSAAAIASFDGYTEFRIGPGEGNLSRDGRLIVVDGKRGKDHVAFAYDLEEKRKYPDINLNDVKRDWVSISASGRYIVLNGGINGERGDQTQIFDLDGQKAGRLWEEYGCPSHYDLTIDDQGDDVAVGVAKSRPHDGRVIKRRLRDGKITVLTAGGYASHTSARNIGRPGWVYVTFQHRGPTRPPYWDEVVAVKLDGSMTVERIAHLHTQRVDYLTEAHAVPSPDGNRVVWASAWGAVAGRPISAYVAERRPLIRGSARKQERF